MTNDPFAQLGFRPMPSPLGAQPVAQASVLPTAQPTNQPISNTTNPSTPDPFASLGFRPVVQPKSSLLQNIENIPSNIVNSINQGGQKVIQDVQNAPKLAQQNINPDQLSNALTAINTTGHIAGDIAGTAGGMIGSVISPFLPDNVKQGMSDALKFVQEKINSSQGMTPEFSKSIGDFFNAISLEGGAKTGEGIKSLIPEGRTGVSTNVSDIINGVQSKMGGGNIQDSVLSSIDRLNARDAEIVPNAPEAPIDTTPSYLKDRIAKLPQSETPNVTPETPIGNNPLALYDKYYNQELKFKGDNYNDTALGTVGTEELSPAVDQVIKMKQVAGATMGSEMKNIGNTPVDITHTFAPLEEELNNNGLNYNAEDGKLVATRSSKVSGQDTLLLQDYVKQLNALGSNPTAAELDAFLSRTPAELKVYKNANNITGTTNGERIIEGNLSTLKAELTPAKNPIFTKYAQAKSDYASLSQFLDQGEGFIGKKTASGDFAKDSSMMKSSVQSMLNNGKKDWLIKLEKLTGNPILAKATLALQAGADAGNYQARSLLDLMSQKALEGGIPTSPHGAVMKAAEATFEHLKEKFVGSPYEQTRRAIEERMKNGGQFGLDLRKNSQTTEANQINKSGTPKGGKTTNKSNINKNSVIDNTLPQNKGKSNRGGDKKIK